MNIRFGSKARKIYLLLVSIAYVISMLMIAGDVQHKTLVDRYDKISKLNTSHDIVEPGTPKATYPQPIFENHPKVKQPLPLKKYILVWTPYINPFHIIKPGQKSFIQNQCDHKNCYFIYNRHFLKNITEFDAVLFSGCALRELRTKRLPKYRSIQQKYIFATIESSHLHPVTDPIYDNFFNWTWTYRLSSDVNWNYVTIYDLDGNKIGPHVNMHWPEHLKPIGKTIKSKLKGKTKAVAWVVSHCRTHSRREQYISSLDSELRIFNHSVDEYGACCKIKCGNSSISCHEMLSKDYYFYLSFENSFDEDYVSEKLLTALNNFMVPIVYGGANYSRFLPPGSYFNAREHTPKELAKLINDVLNNSTKFYDFFRWRNHFQYKSSEYSLDICNICTALNNPMMIHTTTLHNKFLFWWNGPVRQQVYEMIQRNFLLNSDLLDFLAERFTRRNSTVLLQFMKSDATKDWMFKMRKEFFHAVSLIDSMKNYEDILSELNNLEKNLSFSFNFMTTNRFL